MDRDTFEAPKRFMERIGLRSNDPQGPRDDWMQVAAWMQETEKESDELESSAPTNARHCARSPSLTFSLI